MNGWVVLMVFLPLVLVGLIPILSAAAMSKISGQPLEGPVGARLELLFRDLHMRPIETVLWHTEEADKRTTIFLTGGRSRRLVLSDGLVEQLSPDAIASLAAHELAHWKLGHLRLRSLLPIGLLGVVLPITALGLIPEGSVGGKAFTTGLFLLVYLFLQLKGVRGSLDRQADRFVLAHGFPAEEYAEALAELGKASRMRASSKALSPSEDKPAPLPRSYAVRIQHIRKAGSISL
ncbi:M48 family metalloprotease [Gorillibacterium sp. CAU 1737]|uniref:M48 family metalloprotease n=1 Tax=Gorillibacterium sp. CAU 1737 TaxID=3140362 RepID=UPI0032608E14